MPNNSNNNNNNNNNLAPRPPVSRSQSKSVARVGGLSFSRVWIINPIRLYTHSQARLIFSLLYF